MLWMTKRTHGFGIVLLTVVAAISLNGVAAWSLANITRNFNSGDSFQSSDWLCEDSFCVNQSAVSVSQSKCKCGCYGANYVYLQHRKICSKFLDNCVENQTIGYLDSAGRAMKTKIPTVFLPLSGQIIAPVTPPDWKGLGIAVADNDTVPCKIVNSGHLTLAGWRNFHGKELFALTQISKQTFFQWLGDSKDEDRIKGEIIVVSLECQKRESDKTSRICAGFRIYGTQALTPLPVASVSQAGDDDEDNVGLIVGIICGVLLLLTLVGVALFWLVCWKQQKERMTRKIEAMYRTQMPPSVSEEGGENGYVQPQFPGHHFSQEVFVPSSLDAYAPYQLYDVADGMPPNGTWQTGEINYGFAGEGRDSPDQGGIPISRSAMARQLQGQENYPASYMTTSGTMALAPVAPIYSPSLPPPPRKRLYFNPEFFEPELMVDPPPMAEQFLQEIRKMIDVAKYRIRSRRYVPNLFDIPETMSIDFGDPAYDSGSTSISEPVSSTSTEKKRRLRRTPSPIEDYPAQHNRSTSITGLDKMTRSRLAGAIIEEPADPDDPDQRPPLQHSPNSSSSESSKSHPSEENEANAVSSSSDSGVAKDMTTSNPATPSPDNQKSLKDSPQQSKISTTHISLNGDTPKSNKSMILTNGNLSSPKNVATSARVQNWLQQADKGARTSSPYRPSTSADPLTRTGYSVLNSDSPLNNASLNANNVYNRPRAISLSNPPSYLQYLNTSQAAYDPYLGSRVGGSPVYAQRSIMGPQYQGHPQSTPNLSPMEHNYLASRGELQPYAYGSVGLQRSGSSGFQPNQDMFQQQQMMIGDGSKPVWGFGSLPRVAISQLRYMEQNGASGAISNSARSLPRVHYQNRTPLTPNVFVISRSNADSSMAVSHENF